MHERTDNVFCKVNQNLDDLKEKISALEAKIG